MSRADPNRDEPGAPERTARGSRPPRSRSLAFATNWAPPATARPGAAPGRRSTNPFAVEEAAEAEELRAPIRAALQQLVELNPNGVVVVGNAGQVLLHNAAAPAILCMHPDDLTRGPFMLHRHGPRHEIDVRDEDGRRRTVKVRSVPADWFGRPVHLVTLSESRAAVLEGTAARAFHDPLTGLPSRELFLNRVHDRILSGGRPTDDPMAVARVDLDRFRRVNEFYGAPIGDRVLRTVANRLTSAVGPGDYVARFGDDDFAVFFPPGNRDDQRAAAERVLEALQEPYDIDGLVVLCNPTVGLAWHESGQDEDDLVAAAEVALVADRLSGRGSGAVAVATAPDDGDEFRLAVSRSLARELEAHQLVVSYEPRFDVHDQTLVGLEVVVHWDHPDDGLITIGDNAQVADEDGRVRPVAEWTVAEVVAQIDEWRGRRPDAVLPPVTVPVGTRQLLDAEFRRAALLALAHRDIRTSALRLAVSESALSDRGARVDQALTVLADDGFGIELDHFGTGQASMTTLQGLPLVGVRLDALVVERMAEHADAHRFVEATIVVAHAFDLEVTAVGVETSEQRALLYRSACDHAQGSHLGRPLNPFEVARFLAPATAKAPPRSQGLLRRGAPVPPIEPSVPPDEAVAR